MIAALFTLSALAARPTVEAKASAADIPALASLLEAAGWAPTPELSGAFVPGGIYEATAQGHRLLARDCFVAQPRSATYTATELVTSLQAGVSVRAGLGGGKAESSFIKKLRFDTPTQNTLATLELLPNPVCADQLSQLDPAVIEGAYVVQEVLAARISEQTCGKVDASGRFVGLGAADAEYAAACAMESLEPVAVGYRTIPLRKLVDPRPAPAPVPAAPALARPPAAQYRSLTRLGGNTLCLLGPGKADLCVEVTRKYEGLSTISKALDEAGCAERDVVMQALADWRRHYTNRLACIFTFYGLPFMAIPGHRADAALKKAITTASRCLQS